MCILFMKINQNPQQDRYYLILANIRDEFYTRPTKICSFWDEDNNLIGGKDLERGGTWLAMNKTGKISVLLNILQPDKNIKKDKKSRGHLAVDYLKNDLSPEEYLNEINNQSDEYNGFLMVALKFNKTKNDFQGEYFSNFYNQKPSSLNYGTHAFGNNMNVNELWPKVQSGKQKFEEIVSKFGKTSHKEMLIQEIFELLADRTKYPLDDQMRTQGKGKPIEILEKLNSIYVEVPEVKYGSRTWTVILIDAQWNVEVIEKTMKEPIITNQIEWITTQHSFALN